MVISKKPISVLSENKVRESKKSDVIVQYVVFRKDLIDSWPLNSIITQGRNASVSAIFSHKDDNHRVDYSSPEKINSIHKVMLEVKGEPQILNLSEKLTANGIAHKLWVEQPENIPSCLATKPYPISTVPRFLKNLKLCMGIEQISTKGMDDIKSKNVDCIKKEDSKNVDLIIKEESKNVDRIIKEESKNVDLIKKEESKNIDLIRKEESKNVKGKAKSRCNPASQPPLGSDVDTSCNKTKKRKCNEASTNDQANRKEIIEHVDALCRYLKEAQKMAIDLKQHMQFM